MPENKHLNVEVHGEKQSIRRLIYFGSLTTIVFITVVLAVLYRSSVREVIEGETDQVSESIMEEKKLFLRNAVERTIYMMDHERARVRAEYAEQGLADEVVESIAQERIGDIIRNVRLVDDGYIWVNHIVNYDGGDNYAFRRIHPNLPHTEGQWLSTKTTDREGNRPYEVELLGVKRDGELFFDYYFKKMNSEKVSHKMSFAKLYKPYDWVVATGVYLDDVDVVIRNEKQKMEAIYESHSTIALGLSALLLAAASLSMVFLERHISKLLSSYESRIKRYTENLKKLSTTDALTGLWNRMKLDEVFSYEIRQAERYEKYFSILLLDLDRFKSVNDRFGHQAGDIALVEFAGILRDNCRKSDTAGRWGGEEFLIILPQTGAESASLLAEKIRGAMGRHEFTGVGELTCSIGVSTYHPGDTVESMVERVDKAMYCAKRNGRNRVEMECGR